ncbi:MAG: YlmC/YmxH family sporulation protein [Oscillospiraceae bacterium]|nr:YlmC/YmxH family sporulation protein [Oscillospiraceae bacterium]
MTCRIADLRNKDVINSVDGTRLGCVCDAEFNTDSSRLTGLIIYGRPRWFGLFGRWDDLIVTWEDIDVIGEDSILVHRAREIPAAPRQYGFIEKFLA